MKKIYVTEKMNSSSRATTTPLPKKFNDLEYLEPLTIQPNTYVYVEQKTKIMDKRTQQETKLFHTAQVLIPPTLNSIVGYDAVTDTVVTEFNHSLNFGIKYYPLINLQMDLIGGHFPQSKMTQSMTSPILSNQTIIPNINGFGNQYKYQNGYLQALTGETTNHLERHVVMDIQEDYSAVAATSYVHAPKPTLVELFTMLNAAINDLQKPKQFITITLASNATPIVVTTAASHNLCDGDEVSINNVIGNTAANGTFNVIVVDANNVQLVFKNKETSEIQYTTGNGGYVSGGLLTSHNYLDLDVNFGFDDSNNTVVCSAPQRIIENQTTITKHSVKLISVGAFGVLLGFPTSKLQPTIVATVPPSVLRRMSLKTTAYTPSQVCDVLNNRLNPLLFTTNATLHFILNDNTPFDVHLMSGRYSIEQVLLILNLYLNGDPANVVVSYNAYKFTFTGTLPFTLTFDDSHVAQLFGFTSTRYTLAASYTSTQQAIYGVETNVPDNNYNVTYNTTTQKYTFATIPTQQYMFVNGTKQYGPSFVAYCPKPIDGNGDLYYLNFITTSFREGDILSAKSPRVYVHIGNATNTSPIVITTTQTTVLMTNDVIVIVGVKGNTATNGKWKVVQTEGNNYELYTLSGTPSVGNGNYMPSEYDDFYGGYLYTEIHDNVSTNTYTVIVESPYPDFGNLKNERFFLRLKGTTSIYSTLNENTVHEALKSPENFTNAMLFESAQRNVFQLFFKKSSNNSLSTFGFPPISYPPSTHTLQTFNPAQYPTYNPILKAVPVTTNYSS